MYTLARYYLFFCLFSATAVIYSSNPDEDYSGDDDSYSHLVRPPVTLGRPTLEQGYKRPVLEKKSFTKKKTISPESKVLPYESESEESESQEEPFYKPAERKSSTSSTSEEKRVRFKKGVTEIPG